MPARKSRSSTREVALQPEQVVLGRINYHVAIFPTEYGERYFITPLDQEGRQACGKGLAGNNQTELQRRILKFCPESQLGKGASSAPAPPATKPVPRSKSVASAARTVPTLKQRPLRVKRFDRKPRDYKKGFCVPQPDRDLLGTELVEGNDVLIILGIEGGRVVFVDVPWSKLQPLLGELLPPAGLLLNHYYLLLEETLDHAGLGVYRARR